MHDQLLIIHLGGTISMSPSPHGLTPNPKLLKTHLEHIEDLRYQLIEFDPLIDSSLADYELWQQVAELINQHSHQYAGIIVIQGTDTLAYAACALRFFLPQLTIPLIVTGAQYPLGHPESDAQNNLQFCFEQALRTDLKSVYIGFNQSLLLAEKTSKYDTHQLDAFFQRPLADKKEQATPPQHTLMPWIKRHVSTFLIQPSISGDLRHLLTNADVLVLQCYGSGTIPKTPEFEHLLLNAQQRSIPVIIQSQCLLGEVESHRYAAASWLQNYQVINAGNMSTESIIAKCQVINADTLSEFTHHFEQSWFAERD